MAGYAVTERIERATPRVVRHGMAATAGPAQRSAAADETIDLVGRSLDDVLAERWAALRERWAQTTFFLFDADSWRT